MLDIDLSILGAPHDDYALYARGIFDEYVPAVTSEPQFRIGRLEFLHRIAAMPHIFLTGRAQDHWERAARANVAWEIDGMSKNEDSSYFRVAL